MPVACRGSQANGRDLRAELEPLQDGGLDLRPVARDFPRAALECHEAVEELAYRGALVELLSPGLGAAAAVALSAALFGLSHLTQGWRGVGFSAAQALAFQGLVLLGGGLELAIVAHFAYDLGAHLLGRRLARATDSA